MSTLYITTQGATIQKRTGRFLILSDGETIENLPEEQVRRIVLCGNINITTPAITFCLEKQIEVVFLSQGGKFRGRLNGDAGRSSELRKRQYARSNDTRFCLMRAREIVSGKIENQIAVVSRFGGKAGNSREVGILERTLGKVKSGKSLEQIMGYEGSASSTYFRMLGTLVPKPFEFKKRQARPPRDEVNALLSLTYTLLYNRIVSNLNLIGLDPYLGFLHAAKNGHAALASDLLEEFRPLVADTLVLKLLRRNQLKPEHFDKTGGRVMLSKEGKTIYFKEFENKMASTRKTDYRSGWEMSFSEIIRTQSRHFADVIEGKAEHYQPYKGR